MSLLRASQDSHFDISKLKLLNDNNKIKYPQINFRNSPVSFCEKSCDRSA